MIFIIIKPILFCYLSFVKINKYGFIKIKSIILNFQNLFFQNLNLEQYYIHSLYLFI